MITSKEPKNWQELQNEVAKILEECGFSVEIEKVIKHVRGEFEIDVYAEEIIDRRNYIIICECKYWQNRVPQQIIHSFRTVLTDIGANIGYIISMVGFQSGAFKASEFTNLELVTWDQFQEAFLDTWYEKYFINQITERLDPLLKYCEPFYLPSWFKELTDDNKKKFIALIKKYDHFSGLMEEFTSYRFIFSKKRQILPINTRFTNNPELKESIPENIASATGYREFLEMVINYGEHAISQLRDLKNNDQSKPARC